MVGSDVITGISGATHDKTAALWSADFVFVAFLNNIPDGYVVLGDPAYRGLHPIVITTYTGANLLLTKLFTTTTANACGKSLKVQSQHHS